MSEAESLNPLTAAAMAEAVYGIRTETSTRADLVEEPLPDAMTEAWSLRDARVVHGQSGAVFRPRSGFGLMFEGRRDKAGHRAVALRGTKTGWDWLSNLNASLDLGPGGTIVHAGFGRVYGSLSAGILDALGPPSGPVHVVGHSLGGALAQLLAADLHDRGHRAVKLYTFGAPRAFTLDSTPGFTASLGPEDIHRVYDLADPVPMIPLWPFRHAPDPGGGIRVGGHGTLIWHSYHFMDNYRPLVERAGSWRAMARLSDETVSLRDPTWWLDQAREHVRIPGASFGFWALSKALRAIAQAAYVVVGAAATGATTLLDLLGTLLMRGAERIARMAGWIEELVSLAMRWIGRQVPSGETLTARFLRWVLELLLRPIAAMTRTAISRLLG